MNTELHLLETVSLPYEAVHLKQLLEASGIEAYVEGLNGSNAFGMNALMGSIKIKVRGEHLPAARQVLSDAFHRASQAGEAWYCGQCQETNEASFDICWQCGGSREEVAAERPAVPASPANDFRPEDMLSPQAIADQYHPGPYAPPLAEPALPVRDMDAPSPEPSAAQLEYEDTMERAYRASILGLVTLPVVLHIYSFVLLAGALSLSAKTTPRTSTHFRVAIAIDMAVFATFGVLTYLIWNVS